MHEGMHVFRNFHPERVLLRPGFCLQFAELSGLVLMRNVMQKIC